jgi:hypothetical protein
MGSIVFPIQVLLIDPNKEDRQYYAERLAIHPRPLPSSKPILARQVSLYVDHNVSIAL